ncbi:MAG: CYTH domain-containing protein, partial [Muribaculaceae bacterium]
MGKEIEHKYLVVGDEYKSLAKSVHHIRQGYLSTEKERTVRVRIYDDKGYITVKGANHGDTRLEFEYEIPVADAEEMLATLCVQPI